MIVAALAIGAAAPASAIEVGVGIGGIGVGVGIGDHGGTSANSGSDSGTGTGSSTSGSDIAADVSVNGKSLANAQVDLNGKRGARADVALGRVSDGKNGAVIGVSLGRAQSATATPANPGAPGRSDARSGSPGDGPSSIGKSVAKGMVGHVVKASDGTVLGIVERARPGPGNTLDMRMQVASTLGLREPVLTLRVTPASAKDGVLGLNVNRAQFKRQVQ
ncbi:MAG: hypothetical protein CML02_08790 [Pseudooceanicola sp.]|jgi:hypothetical protein|nr:hypothetical protein [Pseudooceanicola sp.]|tara:strand:+ start:1577 stop:2233 length:657 start_codon:yes stop_codon:yes gene_type:complete